MDTLINLFEESVNLFADNIYLWENKGHGYEGTTYSKAKEKVLEIAAGLMSIGINKGDRIGILSEGRNNWIIGELGILYAGACSVPLSVKLDASTDLKFRLQHSGTRMLMISGLQAPKLEEIKSSLPDLEYVIYFDNKPSINSTNLKEFLWDELVEKGSAYLYDNTNSVNDIISSVQPDDLANISYTSGTTADPKGIMLTHRNYRMNVKQALTLMDIPPTHKTLALLPWDHSFAHTACLYCFMAKGASVASVQSGKNTIETLRNVPVNIKQLKPNLMMSVPALSRNFKKNIESGIEQKGKLLSVIFKFALKCSYLYNDNGFLKGKGWKVFLSPLVSLFDILIYKRVRESLGGNMEFFIGGGALLNTEIQRFFLAIGIPVCQGYGLSEASPIISSNSPKNLKIGTSGKLVKYLELKICSSSGVELPKGETGEIVIKGQNVMKGYWKNEKATNEVLKDGWLYTGDLGYIDEDDYLIVLGRYKSLLIANDGEKYSPEGIEEAIIEKSHFITQFFLHNNQQPYTTALIVPAIANLKNYLNRNGIDISSEKAIEVSLRLIDEDIRAWFKGGKYEGKFPERWLPASVGIVPEGFTEDNHLLNSSLKIVRSKVEKKFSNELEFLYTSEAKSIINRLNTSNLRKWLG